MSFDAVLFDCDGVLFENIAASSLAWPMVRSLIFIFESSKKSPTEAGGETNSEGDLL